MTSKANIEALREALAPFARFGAVITHERPNLSGPFYAAERGGIGSAEITVEHFRAAMALLAEHKESGE